METRVQILASFHRYVSEGEEKLERKEPLLAGATVTVSEEDARDWIAKGLARAVEAPRAPNRRDPEPAA